MCLLWIVEFTCPTTLVHTPVCHHIDPPLKRTYYPGYRSWRVPLAHVSNKLSNSLEGALAGGGDPATSPLYVFGPFLRLIVVAGVAQVTFGASIWLVVVTIALVSATYRLVMIWIIDGSGGSGLSEEEFGGWAVKLNASITFVEYTLTFLVSMAALVTFIADRFPVLNDPFFGFQFRTYVAIGLSIMTGWMVNRGPKTAARAFGPATAGVLLLLWAMIIATIVKLGLHLPSLKLEAFTPEYLKFTLGGYVRILAVMTGIEIFANLVAAYEGKPSRKSRMAFRSLLIIMGTTSVTMLIVGPAILVLSDPTNTEVSVFTQTMDQLLPAPLAFLGTLVGVLVLLSASAASAQGLQNLALGLKHRHYIPSVVGQRNAFGVASMPVWIEVAIVSICFLAIGTNAETYLAIYAAGVFILLSMTGWAATNRLIRQLKTSLSANNVFSLGGTILAATFSSLATVIIFVERFKEGAWTYFILLPFFYLLFSYFRYHLSEPTPVEERRGRLFAERRNLPFDDQEIGAKVTAIQRILVPLDGSPFAEEALQLAQSFSGRHSSQLVLLSVQQTTGIPRAIPFFQSHGRYDGDLMEHEKYLLQVAGKLGRLGENPEVVTVSGNIVDEITITAQQKAIDLLIMSTHGRSGIGRAVIGSVADKVINQINIPTLLIRPGSDEPSRRPTFARILVPLDGSTRAEQVLPFANVVAGRSESEILLLSVPDEFQTEAQQDNLRQYLETMAKSLRAIGFPTKTLVTGSTPGYTIVEVANSEAVDLIMLATHGRGGFARLMLGSVADTVIRHTRQPVFLVPVR